MRLATRSRVGPIGIAAVMVVAGFVAVLVLPGLATGPATVVQLPVATTPHGLEHGLVLGAPTAPLELDVWSDSPCPTCDAFWTAGSRRSSRTS
jgi:hypothetical protein